MAVVTNPQLQEIITLLQQVSNTITDQSTQQATYDADNARLTAANAQLAIDFTNLTNATTAEAAAEASLRVFTDAVASDAPGMATALPDLTAKTQALVVAKNDLNLKQEIYNLQSEVVVELTNTVAADLTVLNNAKAATAAAFAAYKAAVDAHVGN